MYYRHGLSPAPYSMKAQVMMTLSTVIMLQVKLETE